MISVSAGRRRPSFCARGSRTARLWAVRTRRSRSARRPSSEARSSRRSASARAALSEAVWRAITSHSAASSATSQKAIQCRPLNFTGRLERAELRRTGARIRRDLAGVGPQGLLGEHASQGLAPARAHGLTGRTDAVAAPLAKCVFHDAIFAGVIRDDAEPTTRHERVAQPGQRGLEGFELVVHGNAQRLKQPREIRRDGPCGRAQHRTDFARLFQALRIAVNDELESLETALPGL